MAKIALLFRYLFRNDSKISRQQGRDKIKFTKINRICGNKLCLSLINELKMSQKSVNAFTSLFS